MPYAVILTANAEVDIQQAINWEEERSAGLGKRFFDVLERLKDVAAIPSMGSFRYDNVRCAKVKTFQYLVHYMVNDEPQQVIILRVLHTSRKPTW